MEALRPVAGLMFLWGQFPKSFPRLTYDAPEGAFCYGSHAQGDVWARTTV
ncbi:MAG: hypothetical protein LUO89_03425 [Methanothrix sp.]|nr:hypothetical protein [Methanothrix sp.]